MKKLIVMTLLSLLLLMVPVWAGTCGSGYTYYRTVTINHLKVPNADQSNYPMGFITTQSYLAVAGSGGHTQSTSGFDIIFCDGLPPTSNQLSHEIEQYVSTTGEVEYWVKVPSVSHTSTETVIYLVYGKAGATDTQNVNAVWSNSYHEVYHLSALTGTPGLHDSTSTGNNLTNHAGTATTGVVDGAVGLVAANSAYLSGAAETVTNPISVEAWVFPVAFTAFPMVVSNLDTVHGTGWDLRLSNSTGDGHGVFVVNSSPVCYFDSSTSMTANATHYLVGTATGTPGAMTLTYYRDGGLGFGQVGTACTSGSTTVPLNVGARNGTNFFTGGWIDEVRVSSVVRDGNWVLMNWNNINSPSTFFTLGAENNVPAAGGIPRHNGTVF